MSDQFCPCCGLLLDERGGCQARGSLTPPCEHCPAPHPITTERPAAEAVGESEKQS